MAVTASAWRGVSAQSTASGAGPALGWGVCSPASKLKDPAAIAPETQRNIQLPEVLSDVTGVTGMAILRAIVAGERRGAVLARLRRPGCRRTEEDIIQALTGTWRDEHR